MVSASADGAEAAGANRAVAASSPYQQEVEAAVPGDSRLMHCIQCGTCGGSCPSGPDMDHTPRQLFAMVAADLRAEVLRSNTPWFCVSCYYCTTRCPQELRITEIMYALKRLAIAQGQYRESAAAGAPGLAATFIDFVEQFGRSFELGLATRYHLRHRPLSIVKMATGMRLGMLVRGRMDLTPTRIEGVDQLRAILAEAESIGGPA